MSDDQVVNRLKAALIQRFGDKIEKLEEALGELTIEISPKDLTEMALILRDEAPFRFNLLADLSGVDYLHYGLAEWETDRVTSEGFDRAVLSGKICVNPEKKGRFSSVYHLLSTAHNHRLRLRIFVPSDSLTIDSVVSIWPAANWYERESFDLFGIIYQGHPDLRRLLTDYGFIGHPFRKDFPLSGHVEVRYDAAARQVIYEPVDIDQRVLQPKVIRQYSDDS